MKTAPETSAPSITFWANVDPAALRDVLGSTTSSLHALLLQFAREEDETDFVRQWQAEAGAVMQEYHNALTGSQQEQWETYMRHSQRENDLLELVDWIKTHPVPA